MTEWELIRRLVLAAAIGGLIGGEREVRQKSAGFRTNILIAMGSAVFTVMSLELAPAGADPTRIASQIVTGIGFLGAGAIMRTDKEVHGLTTAATVWVNAALAVAAGAGKYDIAIAGGALTMIVLLILAPIEAAFDRRIAAQRQRNRPTPS